VQKAHLKPNKVLVKFDMRLLSKSPVECPEFPELGTSSRGR
jgi:hypothetical protein